MACRRGAGAWVVSVAGQGGRRKGGSAGRVARAAGWWRGCRQGRAAATLAAIRPCTQKLWPCCKTQGPPGDSREGEEPSPSSSPCINASSSDLAGVPPAGVS